jgi:hypothetical protein
MPVLVPVLVPLPVPVLGAPTTVSDGIMVVQDWTEWTPGIGTVLVLLVLLVLGSEGKG